MRYQIIRRPVITSLYDVVCNIRDDEQEHVNTMAQCQDPQVLVQSPNTEAAIFSATLAAGLFLALNVFISLTACSIVLLGRNSCSAVVERSGVDRRR